MTDPCDDRLSPDRPAAAAWMQPQRSPVHILKHECPSCGAPVVYSGPSRPATCPYCGTISSIHTADEHSALAGSGWGHTAADILGKKVAIRRT